MSIREALLQIKKSLPPHVRLIAVSKNRSVPEILEAYHAGHIDFGENRVQELVEKQKQLPENIQWHLIGHLQTNKVKYIAPFITWIHSVDSLRLLIEINKHAEKHSRIIKCLLQMYIATEETKYGMDYSEACGLLLSEEFKKLKNVQICGLMGMATFTDDVSLIREEFRTLARYFREIKENFFKNDSEFSELSMGMSNDYQIAIEEGATMIRIGTAIFGERNYNNL